MNNFYVYVYLNPLKIGNYNYGKINFNYEPFYVGKGCNNRCNFHTKYVDEKNKLKQNIINKIIKNNKNPIIIKLYENITEYSAFRIEKYLINLIGRRDIKTGCLSNLTNGGDGVCNYVYTYNDRINKLKNNNGIVKYNLNGVVVEIFDNIVILLKKYPRINQSHIHRACKSNGNRIIDKHFWKYLNCESIGDYIEINNKFKSILQYDLNGNLLKIWKSVTDIHNNTGYSSGAIHKCCRNNITDKSYKYMEYMWHYQTNETNIKINPYLKNSAKGIGKIEKRKIQMFTIDGKYINTYSPKELKYLGYNTKTIYMCCNSKIKKSQGYVWSWIY